MKHLEKAWGQVVAMRKFTVEARRSGTWWALSVPELRGVHSQAKRLDQACDEARDVIALMLDVSPEEIQVDLDVVLPEEAKAVVERVRRGSQPHRCDASCACPADRCTCEAEVHMGVGFYHHPWCATKRRDRP